MIAALGIPSALDWIMIFGWTILSIVFILGIFRGVELLIEKFHRL